MRKVVTKLLILTLLELLKLKLLTLTWLMSNKMRNLCLWLKLDLLGITVLIMIKFQLTLLRLGIIGSIILTLIMLIIWLGFSSTFVSTSVSIEASYTSMSIFVVELVL